MSILPPPICLKDDDEVHITLVTSATVIDVDGWGLHDDDDRIRDHFLVTPAFLYILRTLDRSRDELTLSVTVNGIDSNLSYTIDLINYSVKVDRDNKDVVVFRSREQAQGLRIRFLDASEALRFADQLRTISIIHAVQHQGVSAETFVQTVTEAPEVDPSEGRVIGVGEMFDLYLNPVVMRL